MTKKKAGKGSKQDDIIITSCLYKFIIESSKGYWLSLEPDESPNEVLLSIGEKNIGTKTILIDHKFIPYLIEGLSKYIETIKES